MLQQLASEWQIPIPGPIVLHIDNAAAVAMSVANGVTTRFKHIDTRAHYVNEQVQRGKLITRRVPGSEHLADMFTKPLPLRTFLENMQNIRSLEQGPARG